MKQSTPRYNGSRLGALLAAQGRRQDWLAKQVGVSQALVSRLISEQRTVDEGTARRICGALQVPIFLAFDIPVGSEQSPKGNDVVDSEGEAA